MSDEEEEWMSESESDGDFSASEDEWLPGSTKDKKGANTPDETIDSESDDLSSDDEVESDIETEEGSDSGTPLKMTRKQAAKRGGHHKTASNTSQDTRKLFSKYKPAPLQAAGSSSSTGSVSTSLSDILKRAEYRSKKLNSSQSESQVSSSTNSQPTLQKKTPQKHDKDDESSSSGDEHLVPADQINLNSDFFNVQSTSKPENPPEFDCNAGIIKSDESGSDSEPEFNGFSNDSIQDDISQSINKKKTPKIVAQINQGSSKVVDLQELHRFNQNLEDAKKQLRGFQSKSFGQEDVNVSQLLAMGEEAAVTKTSSQRSGKQSKGSKRKHEESGSDWEEVEGKAKKLKQNDLLSYFKKKTPT